VNTEKLILRIREKFPGRRMEFGVAPAAIVTFFADHPDVGDVQIFDEGSELTLVAGYFTHGHFSDFSSASKEEAEANIVEDIAAFLDRLFADQVVLWGSNQTGGGWYIRELKRSEWARGPLYVWSGPLKED
jgi:hypothetical protein